MSTKARRKTQRQSNTTTHLQKGFIFFSKIAVPASILLLLIGSILLYQLLKQDPATTREPTGAGQKTAQTNSSTAHDLTQGRTSDAHDGHTHDGHTHDRHTHDRHTHEGEASEKQTKASGDSGNIDFQQDMIQLQDILEQLESKYPELVEISKMSRADFDAKYRTPEARNAIGKKAQEANTVFTSQLHAIIQEWPEEMKEEGITQFRQKFTDLWGAEAAEVVIKKLRADLGM